MGLYTVKFGKLKANVSAGIATGELFVTANQFWSELNVSCSDVAVVAPGTD